MSDVEGDLGKNLLNSDKSILINAPREHKMPAKRAKVAGAKKNNQFPFSILDFLLILFTCDFFLWFVIDRNKK